MSYKLETNANKIHKMLKQDYGFEGFMHETSIGNLCNILKCGMLKSRSEAKCFDDSADHAVLNHTDKHITENARFYFFKKTPTNYRFDESNPNGMVYIVFDWDIIFLDNVQIANGNAGSDYTTIKKVTDYLSDPDDFMDWDSITHRSSLPYFGRYEIIRKRNAEIIVPKGVPVEHISKIVFKSEKAVKEFKNKFGNDILLSKFEKKIEVDSSFFCF